jgi:hypothetical protein
MKKTLIATAVGLTLMGSGVANAALVENVMGAYTWDTDRANFTMLTPTGAMQGGTNDVVMHWDGNAYNNISDYTGLTSVSNITASSDTLFSSNLWTAHNVQVFTEGTYVFNTALSGGNLESGNMTLTVGANQLGMHMLFDWNGNYNIDVAVLAAPGQTFFGSGVGSYLHSSCVTAAGTNCLYNEGPATSFGGNTKANRPAGDQAWLLTSIDGDGDAIPGIKMAAGGPFQFFQANFNANMTATAKPSAIPVPAAVWLLGSGLLGLVGVARRKKSA